MNMSSPRFRTFLLTRLKLLLPPVYLNSSYTPLNLNTKSKSSLFLLSQIIFLTCQFIYRLDAIRGIMMDTKITGAVFYVFLRDAMKHRAAEE